MNLTALAAQTEQAFKDSVDVGIAYSAAAQAFHSVHFIVLEWGHADALARQVPRSNSVGNRKLAGRRFEAKRSELVKPHLERLAGDTIELAEAIEALSCLIGLPERLILRSTPFHSVPQKLGPYVHPSVIGLLWQLSNDVLRDLCVGLDCFPWSLHRPRPPKESLMPRLVTLLERQAVGGFMAHSLERYAFLDVAGYTEWTARLHDEGAKASLVAHEKWERLRQEREGTQRPVSDMTEAKTTPPRVLTSEDFSHVSVDQHPMVFENTARKIIAILFEAARKGDEGISLYRLAQKVAPHATRFRLEVYFRLKNRSRHPGFAVLVEQIPEKRVRLKREVATIWRAQ